ncbi:MAG: hypothetical protein AAFV25_24150 [Bacteroidota bacterium]
MSNLFLSISSALVLFLSTFLFPATTSEPGANGVDMSSCEIEEMINEELNSCNMTFSYQQAFSSCCNTNTTGCACVNILVNGLYGSGCQTTVTDIWFESIFLCSQGQWSVTSPSIQIRVDLYEACPSTCQFVNIPVTMRYTYDCGFGTCQGSYSRNIRMLLC